MDQLFMFQVVYANRMVATDVAIVSGLDPSTANTNRVWRLGASAAVAMFPRLGGCSRIQRGSDAARREEVTLNWIG